jgi:ABC-type nickel/cobalt efflux system permease component RcnA
VHRSGWLLHSLDGTMVQIQLLPTDWQPYSFALIPLCPSNHIRCTLDTKWLLKISAYLVDLTAATKMNVRTHRKMISRTPRIRPSNTAFGPKHLASTLNKLGFLFVSLVLSTSWVHILETGNYMNNKYCARAHAHARTHARAHTHAHTHTHTPLLRISHILIQHYNQVYYWKVLSS